MSAKINIAFVLRKHFKYALRDSDGLRFDWVDVIAFLLIPFALGGVSYFSDSASSNDAVSIIITASSIFAGLLLSLLMLVYDQSKRTEEKLEGLYALAEKPVPAESLEELIRREPPKRHSLVSKYETHLRVLDELVVNISYSIIASLLVIFLCIVSLLVTKSDFPVAFWKIDFSINVSDAFFAGSVIVSSNLIITLLMIVKRVIRLIDDR